MALKNYSTIRANTFDRIQKNLSSHGATDIMYKYKDGLIIGLAFVIDAPQGQLKINLPARIEKVERVLQLQFEQGMIDRRFVEEGRAYKVAWAIIDDWIASQMALLETEMVKMEEIFLPYMDVGGGRTLYEKMADTKFQLKGEQNETQEGQIIT